MVRIVRRTMTEAENESISSAMTTDATSASTSHIAKWFAGQVLFITGSTGYVARVYWQCGWLVCSSGYCYESIHEYTYTYILYHFQCRFMGKVLTEKLLRDCPDIKEMYLLMRTKRGIEPEQRRDDYVNHMVSVAAPQNDFLINAIARRN